MPVQNSERAMLRKSTSRRLHSRTCAPRRAMRSTMTWRRLVMPNHTRAYCHPMVAVATRNPTPT